MSPPRGGVNSGRPVLCDLFTLGILPSPPVLGVCTSPATDAPRFPLSEDHSPSCPLRGPAPRADVSSPGECGRRRSPTTQGCPGGLGGLTWAQVSLPALRVTGICRALTPPPRSPPDGPGASLQMTDWVSGSLEICKFVNPQGRGVVLLPVERPALSWFLLPPVPGLTPPLFAQPSAAGWRAHVGQSFPSFCYPLSDSPCPDEKCVSCGESTLVLMQPGFFSEFS